MEIKTIEPFLDYYEKLRARTLRVIQYIPPEKIEWTYKAGKFSFGDIIRHLAAIERFTFVENARLKSSRYPGHGKELAEGYDAVLAFMNKMHEESMAILSKLNADDLQKKCLTPQGAPITVWKWLRALAEHEIHHRGQIYLYLAMLEVPTPPLYGLTSEEVFARSQVVMNRSEQQSGIQVRLATVEEASSIAAVLHQAFIEYEALYTAEAFAITTPTAGQIEKRWNEGPVWAAIQDGSLVGTVAAAPKGDALYIRSMAVAPSARGRGIGKMLLARVESFAKANGFRRMFLSTTPFLQEAIRLYERFGFERTSDEPHELAGTPLFIMEKALTSQELSSLSDKYS